MSLCSASLQGILARLPEYMCFGACVLDKLLEHLLAHTHPVPDCSVGCLDAHILVLVHSCESTYVNE